MARKDEVLAELVERALAAVRNGTAEVSINADPNVIDVEDFGPHDPGVRFPLPDGFTRWVMTVRWGDRET